MPLSDEPDTSTRPPLNATNSWVINHARELIDYDKYDSIMQWLEDVPNDKDKFLGIRNSQDDDTTSGKSSSSSSSSDSEADDDSSLRGDHPAGEIEDYDQDHYIISQMSIIEKLEAAAAAIERREYEGDVEGDEDEDEDTDTNTDTDTDTDTETCTFTSASFVTASERIASSSSSGSGSGLPGYQTLSSDSGGSDYQSLAPGSLEGESLLEERQKTNLGSEVGSEGTVIHRPLSFSVPESAMLRVPDPLEFRVRSRNTASNLSLPSSNTGLRSRERASSDFGSGNEAQDSVGITRTGSRSKLMRSLSKLFTTTKSKLLKSPFATTPRLASGNGKSKSKSKSKPKRNLLKKHPKTYNTNEHPPAYPEIERCPSPLPSVRPLPPPSPPRPSTTLSPTFSPRLLTSLSPRPISSRAPPGVFRATPNKNHNSNTPRFRAWNTNATPYASSTPILRFSTHGGGGSRAEAREAERDIVCPAPQVAGRLFVPGPSRNQLRVSPFAAARGVEGEIPVVSVQVVRGV